MKYSVVYIVALLCLSCGSLWAQNAPMGQAVMIDTTYSKDEIFISTDEKPFFIGDFVAFIKKNFNCSEDICSDYARQYIDLVFTVEKDGTLTSVQIVQEGINPKLNASAVKVVQFSSGMWRAGKINSTPVRSMYRVKVQVPDLN